jgi:hypothetical protein
VADITTLQVNTGDISNVIVGNSDVTSLSVQNGDVTTIVGAPATVTLERILTLSDASPSDIARTANSGVLEIASRADHVHSIANTLLDGGNY